MQKIQEKAKVVLKKAQDKIKKFTDRKQSKEEKYKVEDLVSLSTKDLKWQMKKKQSEKLIKHFMGLYKIKEIISSNIVERIVQFY